VVALAVGRLTALADVDAVTIDGYGTLLRLGDAVGRLHALLPLHPRDEVERAFRTEGAYYLAHSVEAGDEASLARLHADCTAVFNGALGSSLTSVQYVGALEFEILPGVEEALRWLRARGLALAVVANWDFGLHGHLRRHGLSRWFDSVVTSGEVRARKPDPTPFRAALEALGVAPARAVHIGDYPPHDEEGARAAGMRFQPAPLAQAVAAWS
jgi:HAD superfamily hydrolase (TIGR01509 family)